MSLAIVLLACCLTVGLSAHAQRQESQGAGQGTGQDAGEATGQPSVTGLEPEPPAAPPTPPTHRPGFLDALGRWFGASKAAIDSQFKSTQETLGTLGSQAKDAADSVVAIPGTRIVTGRQLCPTASNGAPDCRRGVEALCRTKGFEAGRTLDITSSQHCPAKVWISGRAPKEGECRMETFVTRAVCQ